jgi:hypothetical protein
LSISILIDRRGNDQTTFCSHGIQTARDEFSAPSQLAGIDDKDMVGLMAITLSLPVSLICNAPI